MIYAHCFEEMSEFTDNLDAQPLYYIVVVVLGVLFGAGIFVGSMGLGITYCRNQEPESFIKRGFRIFCSGYLLNLLRYTIPFSVLGFLGLMRWKELLWWTIGNDILQFAGLAFILFGILKKLKCSDRTIFLISLGMSIVGSFVRNIDLGNTVINQQVGHFIGTCDAEFGEETACFSLLNWFIIVVVSYLYAKKLRHCADTDRYYAIALPVSGVILGAYMAFAIPNRFGLLSGDLAEYYVVTTPNAFLLILGMIFATSVYHFAAKLISEKLKAGIIRISNSLTPIYYAQWIIISGIVSTAASIFNCRDIGTGTVVIIAGIISVISILLGVRCPKRIKKIIS